MRSLLLSFVLGVMSLGFIGVTPSSADAAWWRRGGYAYYPAYSNYSYPAYSYYPAYNYSYYPGYSSSYYPGYSSYYYPGYSSYYYPAAPTYHPTYYYAPSAYYPY